MVREADRFVVVGTIGREARAADHWIVCVPGKRVGFIDTDDGDQVVGYFSEVPPLGTRVGVRGTFLVRKRKRPDGLTGVQFHVDVRSWEAVPAGFDVIDEVCGSTA